MYDEVSHWLPGPLWVKIAVCSAVCIGVIVLCLYVVYPAIGAHAPSMRGESTVDAANVQESVQRTTEVATDAPPAPAMTLR